MSNYDADGQLLNPTNEDLARAARDDMELRRQSVAGDLTAWVFHTQTPEEMGVDFDRLLGLVIERHGYCDPSQLPPGALDALIAECSS